MEGFTNSSNNLLRDSYMLGTPYTVMDKTKVCTHPPYGLLINYPTIIMQIKKIKL